MTLCGQRALVRARLSLCASLDRTHEFRVCVCPEQQLEHINSNLAWRRDVLDTHAHRTSHHVCAYLLIYDCARVEGEDTFDFSTRTHIVLCVHACTLHIQQYNAIIFRNYAVRLVNVHMVHTQKKNPSRLHCKSNDDARKKHNRCSSSSGTNCRIKHKLIASVDQILDARTATNTRKTYAQTHKLYIPPFQTRALIEIWLFKPRRHFCSENNACSRTHKAHARIFSRRKMQLFALGPITRPAFDARAD